MTQPPFDFGEVRASAVISDCQRFRYRLDRRIRSFGPRVAVVMVNPSTADGMIDDQTIKKVLGLGRHLGWGHVVVGNLFARRATDIRQLQQVVDPLGPENDTYLRQILTEADLVIAAWGASAKLPKRLRDRWRAVAAMADDLDRPLKCFGACADGQPMHPLMLAYSTTLIDWSRPE